MPNTPPNNAILASHGTDNPIGAGLIAELVKSVQAALPETRFFETFVDVQQPQVPEVLGSVMADHPADSTAIVPLLLSTGYHVRQDITDAVLEAQPALETTYGTDQRPQIFVTPALGPSMPVIDLLIQRLEQAGCQPDDIVVLAVAGSSDAAAVEECRLVHAVLRDALTAGNPQAQVELAFLSAVEPKLKDLVPKLKFQNPRKRVVVANYLLAPGFFNDLANRAGAHAVAEPLLSPSKPIPEQLVEIIRRRISEAATPEGQLGCTKPTPAEGVDSSWSCAAGCKVRCR
jgi:sirohydrochlorin ferrochelatase